jgi:type VI secretion system protein ImpA
MQQQILDFTQLLKPITGTKNASTQAVGINIRQDPTAHSLYYKMKDARTAARTLERNQIDNASSNDINKHWQQVKQLSLKVLTKYSKDLEITVWFIESLLRLHGFAGLRDGFCLARQLIDNFWHHIYPHPDEDGLTARIAPFTGLNGTETEGALLAPIANVLLTEGNSSGPFNFWQIQQAQAAELLSTAEKRKRENNVEINSLCDIKRAVKETSTTFSQNLLLNIHACIKEFNQLNKLFMKKCKEAAPPSSNILNKLTDCFHCAQTIYKLREEISCENKIHKEIKHAATSSQQHQLNNYPQQTDRQQILATITKAAAFFRATEPHSPLPYLLERAVKWGAMNLPELLHELIADDAAKIQVCNLTGIMIDS